MFTQAVREVLSGKGKHVVGKGLSLSEWFRAQLNNAVHTLSFCMQLGSHAGLQYIYISMSHDRPFINTPPPPPPHTHTSSCFVQNSCRCVQAELFTII